MDLSDLNETQRQAVLCTEGPLLVIAGAGTGKTRVLTYRIAHMIADEGVPPSQILAVTFTNKAANEMDSRLRDLVTHTAGTWISTFHSLCVRILRQNADLLGYRPNFVIYDDDASKRLTRKVLRDMNVNRDVYPVNEVMAQISRAKGDLISAEGMAAYAEQADNRYYATVARAYDELQGRLMAANAMDFDDLIMNACILFKEHPDVLADYQDHFRYISVDEYQDTNHAQYVLTKQLASRSRNIMVVGDDDQSIYSWRGADVRNILMFRSDYPEARQITLEQNYRSSGHILEASYDVVRRNKRRMPKHLFTDSGPGDQLQVLHSDTGLDEAERVVREIGRLRAAGFRYGDIAVLCRMNVIMLDMEKALIRHDVPYRMGGRLRLFRYREVQDAIAYLRLMAHPDDDEAALRIINVPKRKLGQTTVDRVSDYAAGQGIPIVQAIVTATATELGVSQAAYARLLDWVDIVTKSSDDLSGDLVDLFDDMLESSGLRDAIANQKTDEPDKIEQRLDHLDALRDLISSYEPPDDLPGTKLDGLLEWLTLNTDASTKVVDDVVSLMTVHAAKGLEFPIVFVIGLEEGTFPIVRKPGRSTDPGDVPQMVRDEEERRIMYVAMTRAKQRLYLSYADSRRVHNVTTHCRKSRYFRDLPDDAVNMTGNIPLLAPPRHTTGDYVRYGTVRLSDGTVGFVFDILDDDTMDVMSFGDFRIRRISVSHDAPWAIRAVG